MREPLPAGTRARSWCSEACRQAGWPRRHQPDTAPPTLPPGQPRRPATVYQCDRCDTRKLGVQRCEECGTFMRRAGYGGLCPCCKEPIAFDEMTQP